MTVPGMGLAPSDGGIRMSDEVSEREGALQALENRTARRSEVRALVGIGLV
jgi:hypothetical protein